MNNCKRKKEKFAALVFFFRWDLHFAAFSLMNNFCNVILNSRNVGHENLRESEWANEWTSRWTSNVSERASSPLQISRASKSQLLEKKILFSLSLSVSRQRLISRNKASYTASKVVECGRLVRASDAKNPSENVNALRTHRPINLPTDKVACRVQTQLEFFFIENLPRFYFNIYGFESYYLKSRKGTH